MQVLIGTSGFSYAPWRGRFYPANLPASEMLGFYARRFRTVELNHSFYRMPAARQLARWAEEAPRPFVFALKAPRHITHVARLSGAGGVVSVLLANLAELGPQLGPVLFQLPPSVKADRDLLASFLSTLPRSLHAAFEFRHPSWIENEGVLDLLREHEKALCIAETDETEAPVVTTANYGYLRLRRSEYGVRDIESWSRRIRAQPWKAAFVYFKHENSAQGPVLAQQMVDALAGSHSVDAHRTV